MVFAELERETLRHALLEAARADPRITGGAITGSASIDRTDRWSDVDLAFGVGDADAVESVLADLTARMVREYGALDHLDVRAGNWIYRVFFLPNTLQVDLALAPASDFGARAATFRLVFGSAAQLPQVAPPSAQELIGYGWLYALHVRSSAARGKFWQAEYMLSHMREQVLMLTCLRYGLSTREGRGMDALPPEVTAPLRDGLVRSLTADELVRAFRVVTEGLLREISIVDAPLAARLEPALWELVSSAIE